MTELAHEEKNLENLGNMLKTEREIHGLTRRDVVIKTKIPLEQLESIEDGRLSSLPPVFAKGFLRAYAAELGLDAEAIVEDYRQMTGGFKNEPASREPLAPKYIETSVGSGLGPVIKVLMALIIVGAGLMAAFWFSPGFRSTAASIIPALERFTPGAAEPNAAPPEETVAAPVEAAPEASAAVAPANDSADAAANPPSTTSSAPAEAQASSQMAAPPAEPGGTLVLTSRKDGVWAEVTVDDSPAEFVFFKSGQTKEFTAARDIVVRAGQASALAVTWNGRDLGPMAEKHSAVEKRFPG